MTATTILPRVALCASVVAALAAVPMGAAMSAEPAVSYAMTPFKALAGKECRVTAFTDADIVAGTCKGEAFLLKQGEPLTLATKGDGFSIMVSAVAAGNAAGMLTGAAICTRTTMPVPEPCVVRWDAQGKPSALFPRELGGPDVTGTTVAAINSSGDVGFMELTSDSLFGLVTARVWQADGQVQHVKPSIKGAGVFINGLSDAKVATGTQIETKFGDTPAPPAPTPTASPTSPVAPTLLDPLAASDHAASIMSTRANKDRHPFYWHADLPQVETLSGIDGADTQGEVLAASPHGLHILGISGSPESSTPTRFVAGGNGQSLPAAPDGRSWVPRKVNNANQLLGVHRPTDAKDPATSYLFTPGKPAVVFGPAVVPGVKPTDEISLSHLDYKGRLVGYWNDGKTSQTVMLTPQTP